jgi:hypothetical protein
MKGDSPSSPLPLLRQEEGEPQPRPTGVGVGNNIGPYPARSPSGVAGTRENRSRGVPIVENAAAAAGVYCFGGTRVACQEMNCSLPLRFAQMLWKRISTATSLPLMVTS